LSLRVLPNARGDGERLSVPRVVSLRGIPSLSASIVILRLGRPYGLAGIRPRLAVWRQGGRLDPDMMPRGLRAPRALPRPVGSDRVLSKPETRSDPTLPVEATTGTPQDWGTETVWIILLAVVFFCCIRNPKSYTDPRDWGSWRKCDEWPFSPVPAIQEGFSLTLLVLDLP